MTKHNTHTHMAVPVDLWSGTLQYLYTRPYKEVSNPVKALEQCKPVPLEEDEPQSEVVEITIPDSE